MAEADHRSQLTVPDHVMHAAKRMFMGAGTIEVRALAREVGIGRATLYRWNWSREELLSEVVMALAVANLKRADGDITTLPGPERVCDVHDLHVRRISASPGMRTFVRSESEVASRVLLDAGGRVHVGVTRALADFIRGQEEITAWRAPLGPDALAGVITRLTEAFLFGDLIARARPDVDTPDLVLRMMLAVPIGTATSRSPD